MGIIGCALGIVAMQIAVYVTNFREARAEKARAGTLADTAQEDIAEP